jgi:septal ring factor EnvC (AmiA/AmiB activator)
MDSDRRAPFWLKLAVAAAAIGAVVLVTMSLGSSGQADSTSSATGGGTSIDAVAGDYCATKADLLAAVQAVTAADPSTIEQQSSDSLDRMQEDIARLQDESGRAGDAGDPVLSTELSDLSHGMRELHDALESLDTARVDEASAKVVPLVTAVNNAAPVQARCP